MSQELIKSVQEAFQRSKPLEVRVGDTVTVHQRIIEGDKERVQPFNGVVISKRAGKNGNFTVRRIVNNEGVERTFPIDSPKVVSVESVRSGKVRRAKLYYLRDRVGKARRLRDRRIVSTKAGAAKNAQTDESSEASE
ncbi:MAG: 50S ribosomal protein L19 [Phycisphaerae bacterium]|nr:50S ribosomal protein L19 [Phycisphaerae bacterium]